MADTDAIWLSDPDEIAAYVAAGWRISEPAATVCLHDHWSILLTRPVAAAASSEAA
jgi:hypothetical protein